MHGIPTVWRAKPLHSSRIRGLLRSISGI
jgi:hypothetical protein